MAKTNKKKEEVLIENDFYKIISNGKKVIINYNKENLAKANYKSLSKEFERLSKLSMNIIERQTFYDFLGTTHVSFSIFIRTPF